MLGWTDRRLAVLFGTGEGPSASRRAVLPLRYVLAVLGIVPAAGILTVLGDLPLASKAMLLLVAVLVSAVALGRGPAVASSAAAFVTLNWFFTEPRQTLLVGDPGDWIVLLVFLLVAFVTGQLAAVARERTRHALEQERQARALQEVSSAVVDPDVRWGIQAIARMLRAELGAAAVRITLNAVPTADASALDARDAEAAAAVATGEVNRIGAQLVAHRHGRSGTPEWIRIVPPQRGAVEGRAGAYRLARAWVGGGGGEAGEVVLAFDPGVSLTGGTARLVSIVADQLSSMVERVRLRQQAIDAEVLRESDTAKSALIDAVSHDMRTPLASIIASAQTLQEAEVDWSDDERTAFAAAIEQEAQRLDRIVGNLLDLSRLRSGVIHPDKAWYEPVALIREILARMGPRVVGDGDALEVDLPEELPPVALDYSKFDQILTNLVENAARHTPPGSHIAVGAVVTDGGLRVQVDDDGPGLSPRQMRRIFEPFYRADGSAAGGSGLGLSVARGLVESHGGRIWAERRRGGGTRFVFTIPGEG